MQCAAPALSPGISSRGPPRRGRLSGPFLLAGERSPPRGGTPSAYPSAGRVRLPGSLQQRDTERLRAKYIHRAVWRLQVANARVHRAVPRELGVASFLASSGLLAVAVDLRCPVACGCVTPISASVIVTQCPLCVSSPLSSSKDSCHIALKMDPTPVTSSERIPSVMAPCPHKATSEVVGSELGRVLSRPLGRFRFGCDE